MPKILIEGHADIASNKITVVCSFCNHHEMDRALIEINAQQKKISFVCPECKKLNELILEKTIPPPLPRIGLTH